MHLRRINITGFGRLEGEFEFDPERLNLVVAPNEAGKSTLAAAVAAALYSLETDRRRRQQVDYFERFEPWSGAAFRLRAEFQVRGRPLVVERGFGKYEGFKVMDDRGRDVTKDYVPGRGRDNLGEKLTGLDKSAYRRVAFLDQLDPDPESGADSVVKKLQAAVDSNSGEATALDAVERLSGALRSYPGRTFKAGAGMVENELKNLDKSLEELDAELFELDRIEQAIDAPLKEIAELESKAAELGARRRELELERRRAEAARLGAELADHAGAARELESLGAELADLEAFKSVPVHLKSRVHAELGRLEAALTASAGKRDELEKLESGLRERVEAGEREFQGLKPPSDPELKELRSCVAALGNLAGMRSGAGSELDAQLQSAGVDRAELEGYDRLRAAVDSMPAAAPAPARRLLDFEQEKQAELDAAEREHSRAAAMAGRVRRDMGLLRTAGLVAGLGVLGLGAAAAALANPGLWIAAGLALLMAVGLFVFSFTRNLEYALDQEVVSRDRAESLRNLRRSLEDRLELECSAAGVDSGEVLARLRDLAAAERRLGPATRLGARIAELEAETAKLLARADELFDALGLGLGHEPDSDRAAAVLDRVEGHGKWIEQGRALEEGKARLERELKEEQTRVLDLTQGLAHLLRQAGIELEDHETPAQACQALDAAVEAHDRYQELSRNRRGREDRLLPDSRLERNRERLAQLGFGPDEPPPERGPDEGALNREWEETSRTLTGLESGLDELRNRVRDSLYEVESRRPGLVERRDQLRAALVRARRFKSAVEEARDVIQALAREGYADWSVRLKKASERILDGLQGRGRAIEFADDLSFSALEPDGRRIEFAQLSRSLSAGALDQVLLTVRLALARALGAESGFPVLLDDPLARADDRRFEAGFRALAELAGSGLQIIVFSCCELRRRRLCESDPGWYHNNVNEIALPGPSGGE